MVRSVNGTWISLILRERGAAGLRANEDKVVIGHSMFKYSCLNERTLNHSHVTLHGGSEERSINWRTQLPGFTFVPVILVIDTFQSNS